MCEIGGVNVEVEAKSKEQQADYLLEAMRQLDEEPWSWTWDLLDLFNDFCVWYILVTFNNMIWRHLFKTAEN